jgi:hypothetical protein
MRLGTRASTDSHAGALQGRTRGEPHPLQQAVRHRLHVGMDAAISFRGILPGLRAPRIHGGVVELATVEAVFVDVDDDRITVLDESDWSA